MPRARLSFEGILYEIVEHSLTPEQIAIYDAYADAFQIIHKNLNAALEAANITGADGGTYNRHAKAAARSAFESNKQRFFNHLLTAMKCPTLIAALNARSRCRPCRDRADRLDQRGIAGAPPRRDPEFGMGRSLDRHHAAGICARLSEALVPDAAVRALHRRGGQPPFAPGHRCRRQPGAIARSRRAARPHDRASGVIAAGAGRARPDPAPLRHRDGRRGHRPLAAHRARGDRLCVETRPASANFAETSAFMDDDKRILVFSDAGGTGRSYHADLGARNQRQRIHYLLEPGWKADAAIQGLGRSNRTNQKQPPVFRPVATDVKGEKRFLSTIARRLDTLGAITRGQRQTGGQGLFRADDNLESPYASAALRQFYQLLHAGQDRGLFALRVRGGDRSRSAATRTARCARNCRRSRNSSIACWRCASICRTRSSPSSRNCSMRASRPRSAPASTISASRR